MNGHTSIRRTLSLAGITVIDTGGYGAKLLYPVTDHLGSVMAMSDGAGALAAQPMAYGPFGQRRTAGWAQAMPPTTALNINENDTDKGYTGQEGLDAVGLWNYNARLYDPALGRFLSVDPLIAHPGSTQSINPYSYVANNPLNKTDPTGMASTQCTGSGSNRVCTSTTTVTNTPTGSHIPQQTQVTTKTVGGKLSSVSTSGTGSLPGGGIALSTDGNSRLTLSVSGSAVGAKPSNAKNNTNTHDIKNKKPTNDIVGTPSMDSEAKKILEHDPTGRAKEALHVAYKDGKVTNVKSCSEHRCNAELNMQDASFVAHTHVRSHASNPETAWLENQMREIPGPGDHLVLEKFGIPNYYRTPSGAIRVLEYVDDKFRVRTVEGKDFRYQRLYKPGANSQILKLLIRNYMGNGP